MSRKPVPFVIGVVKAQKIQKQLLSKNLGSVMGAVAFLIRLRFSGFANIVLACSPS